MYDDLNESFRAYRPSGSTGANFALTAEMTAVARVDVSGDEQQELIVVPLAGFCFGTYCYAKVYERRGAEWQSFAEIALGRDETGLPYLERNAGADAPFCTVGICYAGQTLRRCVATENPACVSSRPIRAPAYAPPAALVPGHENDVNLVYLARFGRGNLDAEWSALEAWGAADVPTLLFRQRVRGETGSVIGGIAVARIDLTGDSVARDFAIANVGANGEHPCSDDGSCLVKAVRRLGGEFVSVGEVQGLDRPFTPLFWREKWTYPWVRLESANDRPDLWQQVEPWVLARRQAMLPAGNRDRLAAYEREHGPWAFVVETIDPRDPGIAVLDYDQDALCCAPVAYILERHNAQLEYSESARATRGFYVRIERAADGTPRLVSTWKDRDNNGRPPA